MNRLSKYSQVIMMGTACCVSFGVLSYMIVDNQYLEKKRIINKYEKQLAETRKILEEFKRIK